MFIPDSVAAPLGVVTTSMRQRGAASMAAVAQASIAQHVRQAQMRSTPEALTHFSACDMLEYGRTWTEGEVIMASSIGSGESMTAVLLAARQREAALIAAEEARWAQECGY